MTSNSVSTKEDFDWLLCEMTGFMRTQILAVAASLRLAEHLQDGGRTAEDFAALSGIEPSMAFRFLRACTKIGLTACDDGRTFKSTSRLRALHGETPGSMRNMAMVLGTRGQYLLWSEFLTAVHLMLTGNGKERSVAEYSVLFDKVGLRMIKNSPLGNGYVVIETAVLSGPDARLTFRWCYKRRIGTREGRRERVHWTGKESET